MILKGEPCRVVQKFVKSGGGRNKIIPVFKFDDNGYAEIDESKYDKTDLNKFKALFEVVESKDTKYVKKHVTSQNNESDNEMSYTELKSYAKSLGINTYGMKKEEIENAVKEVMQ